MYNRAQNISKHVDDNESTWQCMWYIKIVYKLSSLSFQLSLIFSLLPQKLNQLRTLLWLSKKIKFQFCLSRFEVLSLWFKFLLWINLLETVSESYRCYITLATFISATWSYSVPRTSETRSLSRATFIWSRTSKHQIYQILCPVISGNIQICRMLYIYKVLCQRLRGSNQGWLCVLGGFLLCLAFSSDFSYPNINSYLTSYMRNNATNGYNNNLTVTHFINIPSFRNIKLKYF